MKQDPCTGSKRGGDFEVASQSFYAFLHSNQTQARAPAASLGGAGIETDAIVFDGAVKIGMIVAEQNKHGAGFGVLDGVIESFLNDAIKGDFGGAVEARDIFGDDAHRKTRSLEDGISKEADGRNQAEIVENWRTEFVGILAQLRLDLLEQVLDAVEGFLERGVDFASELGQGKMNIDKQLPGFVVDSVGDAANLFFEGFVHPAEGRDGVLKTAVCHLVRRKGVGEEFRSGFEHGGRHGVRGAAAQN